MELLPRNEISACSISNGLKWPVFPSMMHANAGIRFLSTTGFESVWRISIGKGGCKSKSVECPSGGIRTSNVMATTHRSPKVALQNEFVLMRVGARVLRSLGD